MRVNKKISELTQLYQKQLIDIRRALHSHPELSWEEKETTQRIAEELDKLDIKYHCTEPTGIIANIKGGKPGKTIALRADIDALPVMELNDDLPYKSTVPGKMHACGHDAHTAMLLIAARVLNECRDSLPGTVRLIFQPAEEVAAGAKEMIKQGALDQVDSVFGIHIWSQLKSGLASCIVGPSFASADIFKVKFRGRGGHGSMPQYTIDAAVVASSFVMNIQSIVSRESDPLDAVVVSVGKMNVGTGFNVIAENAELEGTVRCFDVKTRKRVEAAIERYATQVAAIYGATAVVEYRYGTLPLVNEKNSALLAQSVIKEAFGESTLYSERPTTGGEDFSEYIAKLPGCFALVGCGNEEKKTTWAHHHGCFNIDEDALAMGAELYAQYAWAYLNQD